MSTMVTFGAPRGKMVKLTTTLAIVICLGIPVIGMVELPNAQGTLRWSLFWLPLLLLACAAPFMVRGYTLAAGTLIIHRLGWNYRIDLAHLVSATADPTALNGSIRLAGNGGLFAFCGWFRNAKLGVYRAYCTNYVNAVVLRFPDRIVVVTPDQPEKFATAILEFK